MSRTNRLLIAALTVALCASCKDGVTVYEPVPVSSELLVYVPVPSELTQPHEIAKGPLKDCPSVAKARAVELARCNADKEQIRAIEGTLADGSKTSANPDADPQK